MPSCDNRLSSYLLASAFVIAPYLDEVSLQSLLVVSRSIRKRARESCEVDTLVKLRPYLTTQESCLANRFAARYYSRHGRTTARWLATPPDLSNSLGFADVALWYESRFCGAAAPTYHGAVLPKSSVRRDRQLPEKVMNLLSDNVLTSLAREGWSVGEDTDRDYSETDIEYACHKSIKRVLARRLQEQAVLHTGKFELSAFAEDNTHPTNYYDDGHYGCRELYVCLPTYVLDAELVDSLYPVLRCKTTQEYVNFVMTWLQEVKRYAESLSDTTDVIIELDKRVITLGSSLRGVLVAIRDAHLSVSTSPLLCTTTTQSLLYDVMGLCEEVGVSVWR